LEIKFVDLLGPRVFRPRKEFFGRGFADPYWHFSDDAEEKWATPDHLLAFYIKK
jgi:hypothetical protein